MSNNLHKTERKVENGVGVKLGSLILGLARKLFYQLPYFLFKGKLYVTVVLITVARFL